MQSIRERTDIQNQKSLDLYLKAVSILSASFRLAYITLRAITFGLYITFASNRSDCRISSYMFIVPSANRGIALGDRA